MTWDRWRKEWVEQPNYEELKEKGISNKGLYIYWRAGMEELGMDVEKAHMLELTDHIFFSFLPLSFLVVVFYLDPFNGHVLREDMA